MGRSVLGTSCRVAGCSVDSLGLDDAGRTSTTLTVIYIERKSFSISGAETQVRPAPFTCSRDPAFDCEALLLQLCGVLASW